MKNNKLHQRNFLLHLQKRPDYNQPVLVKEPAHEHPARSHLDQLHNEYAISSKLNEVQGVRPVYVMEGTESQPVLLMEYITGQSVAELIGSNLLDMTEKLKLAIKISTILMRIHEQKVMHKDISSGNIMIGGNENPSSQEEVYIIDFGLASSMVQERASRLTPDDSVVGTLAYISPEQTGRMNRLVDYRTDLYSLGIVLFELFASKLPFESGDALEMIHAHIAREPSPLHEIDSGIPGVLSDIVLRLLAKNAEDRYQTAYGLKVDLQNCLEQWQHHKQIDPFTLGQDDFTGRLQIPQKLYGRHAEIETLKAVLDKAISGSAQLLYVAGYSGVGKTALVHEIERGITAKQHIYIEGKFDQLQRTLPYSAWAQAFTQLVNNWLSDSDAVIDGWRKNILDVVGVNGQILIDVIPALEHIIGPQPVVAKLGGIESQNRFNYIFNGFIKSIATPQHPLVVFFDDLQWIDPASLHLIESLLTVQSDSNLLIIGAYRDNEVGPDHILMSNQERMSSENKSLTVIMLKDLAPLDTNQLLADTLQLTAKECQDLSEDLVAKTAGNPFYFRQQLYELESTELLSFNRERGRWVWKKYLNQDLKAGGNVVDLMTRKIRSLPIEVQQNLSMAACIGNQFGLATLAAIAQESEEAVQNYLQAALRERVIFPLNDHYKFAHDRVQQAAYSLISEVDKKVTHLEIGRLLLQHIPEQEREQRIFEIVDHLNIGGSLVINPTEREAIAGINLQAGLKAKASTAYSAAVRYFKSGLDFLAEDCWQSQYDLVLAFYEGGAEAASLDAQFEESEYLGEEVLTHAKSILDKVKVYEVKLQAYVWQGKMLQAVEIALPILEQLGIHFSNAPTQREVDQELDSLNSVLAGRDITTLSDLPEMTDRHKLAAMQILFNTYSPCYIVIPRLHSLIIFEMVRLSAEDGNAPGSAAAYASYAIFLCGEKEDIDSGYQFAKLALTLSDYPMFKHFKARIYAIVYNHVMHWKNHIKDAIEPQLQVYQDAVEVGEIEYAAWGVQGSSYHLFFSGRELPHLLRELENYNRAIDKINQKTPLIYNLIFTQAVSNLLECPDTPSRLIGNYYNEDEMLPGLFAANDGVGIVKIYINKLILGYLFEEQHELQENLGVIKKYLANVTASAIVPVFVFYDSLVQLSFYPKSTPKQKKGILQQVDANQKKMKHWAMHGPMNFLHKWHLVEAERYRVRKHDTDIVLKHYDSAIQLAHSQDFINEEALANELAAKFWLEKGREELAALYMQKAYSCYQLWGAKSKVKHLEQRYPNCLRQKTVTEPDTVQKGLDLRDLDLLTVLNASQQIASEIELKKLLIKLMDVIIQNAGAQKGFLMLEEEGKWLIEAENNIKNKEVRVLQSQEVDLNDEVSTRIINYVARTQNDVVLANAVEEGEFKDDPTIANHKSKSILCIPLLYQGQVGAILYLANDLSTSTFTAQRVELLKMLSSQIMVTLTNAQLFYNLEKSEEKFKEVYDSMVDVYTRSDMEGRCLMVSPSIYNLMGFKPEEILGKHLAILYADPSERSRMVEKLKETKAVENFEFAAIRKDRKQITVSTNMNIYYDNDGKPLGIQASIRDITEKKLAEEALKLEQRRLKQMSNQLAKVEENQREEIAMDLHDSVGQLLASSRLQLAAINDSMQKSKILSRMNAVSQGLRDAIHATREVIYNLYPPQLQEAGLVVALEEWMEKELKEKHNVSFSISTDEPKFQLKHETRNLLFRCVCELFVNVIKHAAASKVNLDVRMRDQMLSISVVDDGKGFVHDTDLTRLETGLGLFSVSERLESIGGTMSVETDPGNGTKVELLIPILDYEKD